MLGSKKNLGIDISADLTYAGCIHKCIFLQ